MHRPILTRSKTEPGAWYSPDGLFRVVKGAGGYQIFDRDEGGGWQPAANAQTLEEARRLIGPPEGTGRGE